ncbi:hypothetical protein EVC12_146 [Rhizobium phage RHph_I42]|nr:hypothetical protein EVC12_146 [Rhizobium phage RHph_I42]
MVRAKETSSLAYAYGVPNAMARGNFKAPPMKRSLNTAQMPNSTKTATYGKGGKKRLSIAHKKAISEGLRSYHSSKAKGKVDRNWIKDAVKKPGALRRAAKRLGMIKGDQKLTPGMVKKLEKSPNKKTAQRAKLAETLDKIRKKR